MRGQYLVHFRPLNLALALVDALRAGLVRRVAAVGPALPRAPRILISQPGHLGDVVVATAVLEALTALFPGCRVSFLIGSWASRVIKGHPAVDNVIVHDHALLNRARGWKARLTQHLKTRKLALQELRRQSFDAAIELSFNFPNNIPLMHAARIPVRIGYTSGGGGPLLTHPVPWQHCPDWSVMRYHELLIEQLVPLGVVAPRVLRSMLPRAACQQASEVSCVGDARYTVVHMGSGGPLKEWPAARWEELVDALLSQGRQLVFTGSGNDEASRVSAMVQGRANCTDLCSRLDWSDFVETIAEAELVVAVDSAAGHVAAAFDVPSVTIAHGMTDAALYKPQSSRNMAVRREVPCLPCYRSKGCPSMDCIRGVTAADVLTARG